MKLVIMLLTTVTAICSFAQDQPESNIVIQYRFEVPRGNDYVEVMRVSRFIKEGTLRYVEEQGLASDCRSWPDSWSPARKFDENRTVPHRMESTILCNEGERHFNNRIIIDYPQVTEKLLALSNDYETYDDYLLASELSSDSQEAKPVYRMIYDWLMGG